MNWNRNKLPAEAQFPRARAENLCASLSIDFVNNISKDLTPPFCTIRSKSSSIKKTSGLSNFVHYMSVGKEFSPCVDRSAKPNATSFCSGGRRARRPLAIRDSKTFAIL